MALVAQGSQPDARRFHDGRHTAITTLAEKGLPDWVIQAQLGHLAPEMMKTSATSAGRR
jgi:integrase